MSQDISQARIDQLLEGLQGVIGVADDIVVYGRTKAEHDRSLRSMLLRCLQYGLKLNPDKCKVNQSEITFYGVICGASGVKPDPRKVSTIHQMAALANQQELLSFMGLANYMGPFIQNLSSLSAPLRRLIKEEAHYQWSEEHQEAFEAIKMAISEHTTLAYFDTTHPITLQVDASMKGLAASLIQGDITVAFASKVLTAAESNYANIEREL